MHPLDVLISLHRGYGLGDAVQVSAVLRHVAKYRPHWRVDLQAEAGRHCVGRGIVQDTFEFGRNPRPDKRYDAEVEILLFDCWHNYHDRPNTRVSSCLRDRFGLDWDEACGRYQVEVSDAARRLALECLYQTIGTGRAVAFHYRGDSSPDRKNLEHWQAAVVCDRVLRRGRVPLLLDWRNDYPVGGMGGAASTGRPPFVRAWGGDAEMNCAVISQCEAFVGIDSGPSKCASATDTPALVVWTGHHVCPFHDPAENTTHLVPRGYRGMFPTITDPQVLAWFESHYNVLWYDQDPVEEINGWLGRVLR